VRGLPGNFDAGVLPEYFAIASRSDPPLCASAVAVEREAMRSVGGFPEGVSSGEDLLTWARLAARREVAYSRATKAEVAAPDGVGSRPQRSPQTPDVVAAGLRQLRDSSLGARLAGLDEYLGHWHAMRSTILVQLGRRTEAIAEMRMAVEEAPRVRHRLMLLLTWIPPSLATRALRWRRAILRLFRPAG
jgi:hypothetical protein